MKCAFITGISGQDGSYLAKNLLNKNYKVIGITSNLKNRFLGLKFLGIYNSIELIKYDNCDESFWKKLLLKYIPDEIYNLASMSSVGKSFMYPLEAFNSNFIYFQRLVDSIYKTNKDIKLFQASSSEMFGNSSNNFFNENSKMNPVSPYAHSKLLSHNLIKFYRDFYDCNFSSGILFNHESCLRGEKFVIKKVINYLVNKKFYKHDKKLNLGNINISRDWGYAPDYVEAMWLINNHDSPEDFVVSSSKSILLKEFVEKSFQYFKIPFRDNVIIDEYLVRNNDIAANCGDNSKIKEKLKWNYSKNHTELIESLIEDEIEYVNWLKNN